jgi:hypothetical protein
LRHEPIITVVLRSLRQPQLAHPMIALPEGPQAPAQFLFDFGQLRVVTHADNAKAQGLYAAVISHADAWRQQGLAATAQAVQGQLGALLGPTTVVHTCCEKNATFFCTPELQRPPMFLAPGLHGAGDYIDGPYPSTLEGAVRSGIQAVETF